MAFADFMRNRLNSRGGVATGLSSLGMRIAGLGASFALGVVLARALGPAQFGVYGLVVALGTLAMTLSLLGTPQLAVREFGALTGSDQESNLRPLARSFIKATLMASGAASACAVVIGWAVDPAALPLVLPGAMAVPFLALTALAASQLRGLGAMSRGQVMDILVRPAAALLVVLAMIAAGTALDAATALWVQFGVAVFAAALSLSWLLPRLPERSNAPPPTPWLAAAIPLCMVDLLRQFDGTYGSILLGWLSSDVELGLFRAAVSSAVVVAMPVTILHIIYAPTVARLFRGGDMVGLQRLLGRISLSATALVGAITLACLLIGRPLINFVFGSAYDGSWAPLSILCMAQLLFALFGMGPILLAMCHRERQLTRIYLVAIAVAIFVAASLVGSTGAIGVAAAQLVSLLVVGGLSWWDGRRALGVDCSIAGLVRR